MSATSRSVYRDTVLIRRDGDGALVPLPGAEVYFYVANGPDHTPLPYPLYPSSDAITPLVLPFVTGEKGEVEVWSDTPTRARQLVFYRGVPSSDEYVDIVPAVGGFATDQELANAIAIHEADQSAHPWFLTEPEGDLLYLPLSHEPGVNPHPQYLPTTHEPGVDPHPQYLQKTTFEQGDPLPQYQLETEKGQAGGYAPLDPAGLIPTAHLPDLAITETFVVANEGEMLALDAQTGDVAIRTDTSKSYILAGMPASLLTNWKELSAAAPVLSVNGYVGVVNLTAADVGALTPAQATTDFVNTTGDTMVGHLGVGTTNAYDLGTTALRWRKLWTTDAEFTNVPRIGGQTLDARYVNANGDVVTGNLLLDQASPTDTVFQAWPSSDDFPRWTLQMGGQTAWGPGDTDVDTTLTRTGPGVLGVNGKPIGISPAAGNIMQWLPDGFFAGLSTANVTVVRRQEFTPGAAATTVTLTAAPSTVLEVSRNGVAQSQALGHYSVAGAVLTFTDSFTGTEQVLVLYEVGVSQPVDSYSKSDSDLRYVNVTGDTVTGPITMQADLYFDGVRYVLPLNAGQGWVGTGSNPFEGLVAYRGYFTNEVWYQGTKLEDRYVDVGGDLMSGALTMDAAPVNAKVPSGMAGFQVFQNAEAQPRFQARGDGSLYFGPGGSTSVDTTLTRPVAGALRVDNKLGLGVNPKAWPASMLPLQLGEMGALWANATAGSVRLSQNIWYDGAGNKALGAGQVNSNGAMLEVHRGGVNIYADVSATPVVAGGTITAVGLASVENRGLFVLAGRTLNAVDTTGNNYYGWGFDTPNARFQVTYNGTVTGSSFDSVGRLWIKRDNGDGDQIYLTRADTSQSMFLGWRSTDNIGRIHSSLHMMISTGQILNIAGPATGHNCNIFNYGSVMMTCMGGGLVGPSTDGAVPLGLAGGYRWAYVAAANGTIQTSWYEAKENLRELDPMQCVDAVLDTDWLSFDYKEPPPLPAMQLQDAETLERARLVTEGMASARHQNGYALGSPDFRTHRLFGLSDGRSKNNGSDLAIVACALQYALQEIADLKARLV